VIWERSFDSIWELLEFAQMVQLLERYLVTKRPSDVELLVTTPLDFSDPDAVTWWLEAWWRGELWDLLWLAAEWVLDKLPEGVSTHPRSRSQIKADLQQGQLWRLVGPDAVRFEYEMKEALALRALQFGDFEPFGELMLDPQGRKFLSEQAWQVIVLWSRRLAKAGGEKMTWTERHQRTPKLDAKDYYRVFVRKLTEEFPPMSKTRDGWKKITDQARFSAGEIWGIDDDSLKFAIRRSRKDPKHNAILEEEAAESSSPDQG
jgi:hypothetical protein